MTALRPALAAALVASLALPAAPAVAGAALAAVLPEGAEPGVRTFDYTLDWGPVHLADISFELEERADGVRLHGEAESGGLVMLVSPFAFAQTAEWTADGTARLVSRGRYGEDSAEREVVWPAGGGEPEVVREEIVDGDGDGDDRGPRTPIPEGELQDTVDPALPIVETLRRMDEGGSCAGTWRVYTGTTRFDLTVTEEAREVIEADRDWTYGGPAVRCRLEYERIGGFRVDDDDRPDRVDDPSDVDRLLWVARLEDGRHAPVRLSVSAPVGRATARIDLRR